MNLEAIAQYLEENECGLVSKTIFVTELPTGCTTGVLLMGPYSGTPINSELPGYYSTEFRIVVRSPVYSTGLDLANKVRKVLTSKVEFDVSGMLVKQCMPSNLPRPYRRSVGAYWEFEVDVDITFVDEEA